MKKKAIIAATVVAALVLVLSAFAAKPIISGKAELSEGYLSAIESQSKGVYASRLPLVPIYVSVESVADEKVLYTIYYFPFGTLGMSYSESDGYNIEKPLTNQ